METYLQKQLASDVMAEELISLANERGGEDNISVIILEHDSSAEAGDT